MRSKIVVLTMLCVLLASGMALAAPEWYAVKTDASPTIDADFSDAVWGKAQEYAIDKDIVDDGGTIIVLHEPLPDIASGKFYWLWDDDCLYLYAKITDSSVYFGKVRGEATNGGTDVIQLCIEPKARRLPTYVQAFILDMTPGAKDGSGPLVWEHFQHKGNVDDVEIASKVTDSGYEIEAAIPWSVWKGWAEVKVGAQFPFGMIILDASESVGAYYLLMDYGNNVNVIDQPKQWNTLNLIE